MFKYLLVQASKELSLMAIKQIKKVVLKLESDLLVPVHVLDIKNKDMKSGVAPVIDIKTKQRIA